jgi:hypothetical protein
MQTKEKNHIGDSSYGKRAYQETERKNDKTEAKSQEKSCPIRPTGVIFT